MNIDDLRDSYGEVVKSPAYETNPDGTIRRVTRDYKLSADDLAEVAHHFLVCEDEIVEDAANRLAKTHGGWRTLMHLYPWLKAHCQTLTEDERDDVLTLIGATWCGKVDVGAIVGKVGDRVAKPPAEEQ